MSNENTEKKPSFDPVKLEQVNVNVDYPMEPDEFEILYKHNCYCHMAHISKFGYPIVTPMFYVVLDDGFIYISSVQKYRAKIDHLIANPKISVSIQQRRLECPAPEGHPDHRQGRGVPSTRKLDDQGALGHHRQVLVRTEGHEEMRQTAFKGVHTPNRAIIKVIPNKGSPTSWDFGKMVDKLRAGRLVQRDLQVCQPATAHTTAVETPFHRKGRRVPARSFPGR